MANYRKVLHEFIVLSGNSPALVQSTVTNTLIRDWNLFAVEYSYQRELPLDLRVQTPLVLSHLQMIYRLCSAMYWDTLIQNAENQGTKQVKKLKSSYNPTTTAPTVGHDIASVNAGLYTLGFMTQALGALSGTYLNQLMTPRYRQSQRIYDAAFDSQTTLGSYGYNDIAQSDIEARQRLELAFSDIGNGNSGAFERLIGNQAMVGCPATAVTNHIFIAYSQEITNSQTTLP